MLIDVLTVAIMALLVITGALPFIWLHFYNKKRRKEAEKSPQIGEKTHSALLDLVQEQQLRTTAIKAEIKACRSEIADTDERLRSFMARVSARTRNEEKLDLAKLGDYIQALSPEEDDSDQSPNGAAPDLGRTVDGDVIDYR